MKIDYKSYVKSISKLVSKGEQDADLVKTSEKNWVRGAYFIQIAGVVRQYEEEKARADTVNKLAEIASGADQD